jgi:hypothetical protein
MEAVRRSETSGPCPNCRTRDSWAEEHGHMSLLVAVLENVALREGYVVKGMWVGGWGEGGAITVACCCYMGSVFIGALWWNSRGWWPSPWRRTMHGQRAHTHTHISACVATPAVAVGNKSIAHATLTRLIFRRQFCCFVVVVRDGEICSCLAVYLPWAVTSSATEVVTLSKVKSKK